MCETTIRRLSEILINKFSSKLKKEMKLNFKNILGMMGIMASLASCKYDNYDEPSFQLDGRITYQGEPIGVSYNDVYIELWESGWQRLGNIGVAVDQDGSYS